MEQTSAKLRKTFRYPTDGDEDDDLPEALDEEEQETLIRILNQTNATQNASYRLALLALPLLSIIPYLTTLTAPAPGPSPLLSLLSITSLLSTAHLLYTLPPGTTALAFLDNRTRRPPLPADVAPADGPVRTYLPYLNLGLCAVLAVLGSVTRRKAEAWWWGGFSWLPGGVYAVVLVAKWIMGSVDPEGELGGLRYEFKGA